MARKKPTIIPCERWPAPDGVEPLRRAERLEGASDLSMPNSHHGGTGIVRYLDPRPMGIHDLPDDRQSEARARCLLAFAAPLARSGGSPGLVPIKQ
jgi:hypothetical protein